MIGDALFEQAEPVIGLGAARNRDRIRIDPYGIVDILQGFLLPAKIGLCVAAQAIGVREIGSASFPLSIVSVIFLIACRRWSCRRRVKSALIAPAAAESRKALLTENAPPMALLSERRSSA
jgi:hypothetical protein